MGRSVAAVFSGGLTGVAASRRLLFSLALALSVARGATAQSTTTTTTESSRGAPPVPSMSRAPTMANGSVGRADAAGG